MALDGQQPACWQAGARWALKEAHFYFQKAGVGLGAGGEIQRLREEEEEENPAVDTHFSLGMEEVGQRNPLEENSLEALRTCFLEEVEEKVVLSS